MRALGRSTGPAGAQRAAGAPRRKGLRRRWRPAGLGAAAGSCAARPRAVRGRVPPRRCRPPWLRRVRAPLRRADVAAVGAGRHRSVDRPHEPPTGAHRSCAGRRAAGDLGIADDHRPGGDRDRSRSWSGRSTAPSATASRRRCSSPGSCERLRGRGRRGVVLLDELLVDSGGHSDLERRFLALVRSAGLPRPTCQRVFRRDGTTLARVDFSFEPSPVIVEVSGRRGHSSDAERARDAQRRNELQHLGFVVLEFTNEQVRRQPEAVIAALRRHLT